jgi:hypothetical protein
MPSAGARLGETANDYLVHLRFGRTAVLAGFEKPEARMRLAELHRALGRERQITDADIVAVQAGEAEGSVLIQLSWYAPGEQLLRSTVLKQRWLKVSAGTWQVDDETFVSGDENFVPKKAGEPKDAPESDKVPASKGLGGGSHYPTVRIGN